MYWLLVVFYACIPCNAELGATENLDNEWVVRLSGGPRVAQKLADEMGYKYQGSVTGFKDTYIFTQTFHPSHQKRAFARQTRELNEDKRVSWAEQQYVKSRQKRHITIPVGAFIRTKRNNHIPTADRASNRLDRTFNDELWSQEWYLQDTRTRADLPKLDLNVLPVYRAGITGNGVRVTILDDGIEYLHEDLKDNYLVIHDGLRDIMAVCLTLQDPDISWDCNENDADPTPRYDAHRRNSHGTRCAGEVAMSANNGKCGVGVAFNAKIGGVKLLDGLVNDRIEGTAIGYAYHLVDIYSASWGPNDDGKTVDGPGTLAREALERGIREGRGGKGAIYVWASGNGGLKGDNCNCDGYLASPYTVSIGSASQRGEFPWYGEECASTLAVTYSSGAYQDQMIATTDLGNECTIKHTGTSASAPLAAGIIALALEANPNLTWRDVQHLITWTSEYAPVADNPGWQRNAGGFWFSTRFGFGLMNAFGLVKAAANWTTVPDKLTCKITAQSTENDNSLLQGKQKFLEFSTGNCDVNYLEHVEVTTTIEYTVRGDLELYLRSATGTIVQLLSRRKLDKSKKGFRNWTFMSVMTWGENPKGVWKLEILDRNGRTNNTGSVHDCWLTIHGTRTVPVHLRNGPRRYNHHYNRIHKTLTYNHANYNLFNNYV